MEGKSYFSRKIYDQDLTSCLYAKYFIRKPIEMSVLEAESQNFLSPSFTLILQKKKNMN